MNNPAEWQGLAHFCEHMLFLGTASYPEEGDFEKFISANGGSNNAYTGIGCILERDRTRTVNAVGPGV